MVVVVPLLVQVALVVGFFAASASAGHGGAGSSGWRGFGAAGGGGPRRWRDGWKTGGRGESALWLCSFNESRFRRAAADGSCSRLQYVVASSSRQGVVRRLRRRLGALGEAVDPIVFFSGGLGCLVHFSGFLCNFVFFGDLFVK